jgi:glutamine synthetase
VPVVDDVTEVTEDADIARIMAELHEPPVELVAGSVTDLAGVTRAKYVPFAGRRSRAPHGHVAVLSVFCVDSGIAFTPDIGVVGDLRIRIEPTELRVIDDGVAWAPGSLHDQHGNPASLCVRSILKRVEARAAEQGLTARVGAELECTMLAGDTGHPAEPWSPYGIRTSLDRAAFFRVTNSAERAGLSIEQLHTEYGHDQLEVSLAPTSPVAGRLHRSRAHRPRGGSPRVEDLVLAGAVRRRGR